MSYFNVLAPSYLSLGIYHNDQIASLSAAYYYGDMIGLLPVGFALDRFPLRKILLWAITGSVISAFLLLASHNFYLEWTARFFCGFFGGTFSFVGGIRVLANLFPNRFSLFMGLFLSAGMFGGLICQYPLLMAANHFGIDGAMAIMASFGVIMVIINLIFLHPVTHHHAHNNQYPGTVWQMCAEIVKNLRNWADCLMIVCLDTPVSVIGTLWGIVLLMNFYHFSDGISAWLVMSLFAGLMIGLPIWGALADKYKHPAWIIILGTGMSLLMAVLMLLMPHANALLVAVLCFGLGLFSSCQTMGFTWLMQGMRPELIGRNSAFNSMIFMGTNGGVKQLGAALLSASPIIAGEASAGNLLILIALAMLLAMVYAMIRKKLFTANLNPSATC
jgi:MFS family permease